MDFRVNIHSPSLSKLQYRSLSLYYVQSSHCYRHSSLCQEVGREASATEVVAVCRIPCSGVQAVFHVVLCQVPWLSHLRSTLCVGTLSCAVERCCSGVNEMDDAVCRLSGKFFSCNSLYSLRTPVCSHVGEYRCTVSDEVFEKHGQTVASVVLCSEYKRLAYAVPVKRGVEYSLCEVAVRLIVSPLSLSLESSCYGIVSESFLVEASLVELLVASHEVTEYHSHLRYELPVFILTLAVFLLLVAVADVFPFVRSAIFANPFDSLLVFSLVVYAEVDTAQYLRHVNLFSSHAEILLHEVGIGDTSGNTHCNVSDGQV